LILDRKKRGVALPTRIASIPQTSSLGKIAMRPANVEAFLKEDSFPGNNSSFAELKNFITEGRITAFTGAGVSAPAFPTWTGLLSGWLDDAVKQGFITTDIVEYRDLLHKDPLELAEMLEQVFTKDVFRARFANTFRNADGSPTGCHSIISNLGVRGIVTLNYDSGHEAAHAAKGRNPNTGKAQDIATLTRWAQNDIFSDMECPILHFHGDVSDPIQMILTSSDYERFYSQSLPDAFLGQLWRAHHLLVIGFGFADPFLTRLAERTLRSLQADTRHFALIGQQEGQPVSVIQRRIFAKKYRVVPIFYEIRQTTTALGVTHDHSDLLSILEALPEHPSGVPTANSEPTVVVVPQRQTEIAVKLSTEKDFRADLFVAPNGNTLYAEPRFQASETVARDIIAYPAETSLREIVGDTASYIITCRQEYGATTTARRLLLELTLIGKRVLLRDASSMPNYKKKLEDQFSLAGFKEDHPQDAILILDNFDFVTNERLLKEIVGAKRFTRIIVLARQNLFETGGSLPVDHFSTPFKAVSLLHLRRADIRTLTAQFYETSDADTISAIVEKVYGDLVTLCIPITPSNVVMYLTILIKDGDFQPINRVQIVNRYLSSMLVSPSDLYRDVFNAKNKMDVLSAFVFYLNKSDKQTFSETDWFVFCRNHMKATLTEFDERHLLSVLKSTRVLVPIESNLYFKYRFFHTFLLGRHIANRPSLMAGFISDNQHLKHGGLVEVIADLASDSEPLVSNISQKLDEALSEFGEKFVAESFDPFAELEWPSATNEEETLWRPLTHKLAAGPRNVEEIDEIKSSFLTETRASDQRLVVQNFNRLERRFLTLHVALTEAMRNSDSLSADLKCRAVVYALKGYLRMLQVGLVLAPAIASKSFFRWHGLTFFNNLNDMEKDETKRASNVMVNLIPAICHKAAEEIGSKKLGEVFKLLGTSHEMTGFIRLLNFSCLIRSKPKDWISRASEIVAATDRNTFYLRSMLSVAVNQFHEEVNTTNERQELKKLVAVIRMRRDRKKQNPGEKDIKQFLEQMEKQNVFGTSPAVAPSNNG
jgi:SIR2-like domain